MPSLGRIVAGLGGPINRVGFLVFATGLAFLLASVVWYVFSDYLPLYRPFPAGDFIRYVSDFDESAEYGWQILARVAFLMIVLGGLTAWFYGVTIGRAVRWWRKLADWIMTGK